MGDELEYDESEARREAAIYRTPAAADRRELVRAMLDPRPGERVLSVGCGPGFEPAELGSAVGDGGHVHGIDRSEAMLALADRRCADQPQVTLSRGDAADLPVSDESVDAAAAVQVFEYVDDVDAAAAELARVLRPGGRAVVCDADFDSLVWRSTDAALTDRVLDAFDDHCPHPRLGSRLAPILRDAGLTVERVEPNAVLETSLDDDSFATHLMRFVEAYAADHDDVGPEAASAWAADLREREAEGATFFDFSQYCYLVRKAD